MRTGSEPTTSILHRAVRIVLLVAAFALPATFMTRKSLTSDEIAHLPAGYSYLVTRRIVLNPMHPPLVKELCALPLLFMDIRMPADAATIAREGADITYQWRFGEAFFSQPNRDSLVYWGRIPAVLLSVALAILVLLWANELWGPIGGTFALTLYVFDPTIDAHSQLVTTDVGLALFGTLFLYALRKYLQHANLVRLVITGLTLGLAMGAKFSGATFVPIAALLLAAHAALDSRGHVVRRVFAASGVFVAILGIAYGVLWVIYLFPHDPFFYLKDMWTVSGDNDVRFQSFLMGELHSGRQLGYFPIAWLVKTPIPSLLLLGAAGILFVRGARADRMEEVFLVLSAIALFGGYMLKAGEIGVRYLIPCFPLFFIFAGRVARSLSRPAGFAVGALLAWYVVEFVSISPDQLSYFNQIAGGPSGGVRWLDDSNVDWGQGLIQLRAYLEQHPAEHPHLCCFGCFDPLKYGIDATPVWISTMLTPPRGTLILSAHCLARGAPWLAQEFGDGPRNWLAHTPPKAVVGHAYYVYDLGA